MKSDNMEDNLCPDYIAGLFLTTDPEDNETDFEFLCTFFDDFCRKAKELNFKKKGTFLRYLHSCGFDSDIATRTIIAKMFTIPYALDMITDDQLACIRYLKSCLSAPYRLGSMSDHAETLRQKKLN
jgi:hypothetical protein